MVAFAKKYTQQVQPLSDCTLGEFHQYFFDRCGFKSSISRTYVREISNFLYDAYQSPSLAQGGDWTRGSVKQEARRLRAANPDAEYIRAPKSLLGNPLYYVFRYHASPSSYLKGEGKEYYLEYGFKYANIFTSLGESTSSSMLKEWVNNTRFELQVSIEQILASDPSIASDRERLYHFAMDSHDDAYRRGGFGLLTWWEQAQVGWAARSDILADEALKEIWDSRDMWGGISFP